MRLALMSDKNELCFPSFNQFYSHYVVMPYHACLIFNFCE